MQFALPDGYNLNVEEVGSGFPLIVLHGGPGLDHTMFRPYLDALGDEYRLLYVDERGQGRSQRVDPATLSLEVFARDVDLLAEALELDGFALLGHSFGAIIATYHATEFGTAAAYVISGGGDASEELDADVEASLEALGNGRETIAASWEAEETVGSPQVLRYFANFGYGAFDYRPKLSCVRKPTLIVVGEHDRTTTPRAARVLHEGIPNSELV